MSDVATSDNPFSPRAALGLVVFGAVVFVALLWMIGGGMTAGSTNDGGAHAGGKGLNGYAALADFLQKRGHAVRRTRSDKAFADQALLVLTPPHSAKAEDIANAIQQHRYAGPTLLVLPKWVATPVPPGGDSKARQGWVTLNGASVPPWRDAIPVLGALDLRGRPEGDSAGRWFGLGRSGPLADLRTMSMSSGRIVPLVRDDNGQALAGFLHDGGYYPVLAKAAGIDPDTGDGDDDTIFPIVVVAEPDLLNNYGFADRERAMAAVSLIERAMGDGEMPIDFDLTMNGHGRNANLLTLAFTPPFLAATLCLLLAAVVVGWRAFVRFGPPRKGARAIAFGKQALVANAAGLIRRTRRTHLVTTPYATRARERLVRILALPRVADIATTEAAIDRALEARKPGAVPFSQIAARLRAAHRPHDILKAAQDLHALERTLIR
jgi:hypothetical protein